MIVYQFWRESISLHRVRTSRKNDMMNIVKVKMVILIVILQITTSEENYYMWIFEVFDFFMKFGKLNNLDRINEFEKIKNALLQYWKSKQRIS